MRKICLQSSQTQEQSVSDSEAALSPLVLLIDQEPTVRKIVEVSLHREGYWQIHAFADGVAALGTRPQDGEAHDEDRPAH